MNSGGSISMLTKSDLMYELPEELIAQRPPVLRGTSRLMILNRREQSFREVEFGRITDFLAPDDALVLNNTRVIRARLKGCRTVTGGSVELLLIEKLKPLIWKTMVRPGTKCRQGFEFSFDRGLKATVLEELGLGRAVIEFSSSGPTEELVTAAGTLPIPPYIKRSADEFDDVRYQTVFAEKDGAVAAPTAGLHFTPEILQQIKDSGTSVEYITLHVGPGTFQPLRKDILSENTMEEERFSVSLETLQSLRTCRNRQGRIIAAGTTVARTLESVNLAGGTDIAAATSIFIHPPYEFRNVDVLLTNFHLPGSSLISLVGSFAGLDLIMEAYREAIRKKFKFYSYGDAMLII
jgi:S-adenosylmethionine:tRNA ribosyltransferase-isomerase